MTENAVLMIDLEEEIPVENEKDETEDNQEAEIDGQNDYETSDDSGYEGDVKVALRQLSVQDQILFLSRRVDDMQSGHSSRARKYCRLQQILSSETARLENRIDDLQAQIRESNAVTDNIRQQLARILSRLTNLELLGVTRESDFIELDNILEMIVEKVVRMERELRSQNIPPAPVPFLAAVPALVPAPVPAPAVQFPTTSNQSESPVGVIGSKARAQCLWCGKTLSAKYIQKHMKDVCKQKPVSSRVRNLK